MKKLIWLIAFLPLFVHAQTIDFSKFATKGDLKRSIDSLAKTLGSVTPVPDPSIPDCQIGITIESIHSVTAFSLSIVFNAVDAREVRIDIMSGDALKYSQIVKPDRSTIPIAFPALAPGRYKLIMTGINCKGGDSEEFTVGSATIPVPPDPDPVDGIYKTFTYSQGLEEHINIKKDCDKNGCRLTDLSNTGVAPGYSLYYVMNGETLRLAEPLNNYLYNSPIPLSIRKFRIRNGAPSVDSYYYKDPSVIQTFSRNCSTGLAIILFHKI